MRRLTTCCRLRLLGEIPDRWPVLFTRSGLQLVLLLTTLVCATTHADDTEITYLLQSASGDAMVKLQSDRPAVPASTVKLITALLALEHWGRDGRFNTVFHYEPTTQTLGIKGSGDPFLVSEELALIAAALKTNGIRTIDRIVLDSSLFAADLQVPGASQTANPYDAVPSALAANFNTINVKRVGEQYASAEPQTPLTAFAESIARSRPKEVGRMNIGFTQDNAEQYFVEILTALLANEGIEFSGNIARGEVTQLPVVLKHQSSRTIGDLVSLMLLYSNNFIASQLILALTAEETGQPADFDQVALYLRRNVIERFGWQNAVLKEGAGLSRDNRLSAAQLVNIVEALTPWQDVIPQYKDTIFAKTGTLSNVSTLAGIIKRDNGRTDPFAILAHGQSATETLQQTLQQMLGKPQAQ